MTRILSHHKKETPAGLAEGLPRHKPAPSVARTPPPIPNFCSHCKQKLGEARVVVHTHDHRGGHFHVGQCFQAAWAVEEPVDYRLRIADAESTIGWEDCQRELVAP